MVKAKRRNPMQVDADFETRVKEIQRKIRMKKGEDCSLREITGRIVRVPEFNLIEEKILQNRTSGNSLDVNINFDLGRRR